MEKQRDTSLGECDAVHDNAERSLKCDAPDEYVNPTTGLCPECRSTALVPVGSMELLVDEERDMLDARLQPHAREFLRAFVKTLTIADAADVVGIARSTHYKWLKKMPGYPEAFEHAQREAKDQWHVILKDRVDNGLEELMYDADGNLKYRRIRQDASLLKMQMMAVDPETYNPERRNDTNVIINVVQSKEGW